MAVMRPLGESPHRLDGTAIPDGLGISRLAPDFSKSLEPNYSVRRTIPGTKIVTYRGRTWNGRRGPSGLTMNTWASKTAYCDDTVFPLIQRIVKRPITHTFHDKLIDQEFFDGDATTTSFYLFRPLLGNTYSSAGNTGTAASSITITREDTAATYTVVYNIAPGAAEVRIDTTGTDAFRKLLFGTAPPNTAGVIRVEGWFLYTVQPHINVFEFPATQNTELYTAFSLSIEEIGKASAS